MKRIIKNIAIGSAVALAIAGPTAAAALGATSAPAPSNLYGCVDGSNRVLEHVFTIQGNFENYLNAHNGQCPNGFPVTVGTQPAPSPSTSSATPTPSATTSSATPTPSTTGTAGPPVCEKTSLDRSECGPYDVASIKGGSNDSGTSVRQEVWNLQPALHKQDLQVWSPSDWQVIVNAAAGNTEVNNYPDVSDTVTDASNHPVPASSYHSLTSTYSENMHATAGTDAEAAYDIWLNNYDNELMIWVDNHGQRPAGNDTGKTLTAGGVTYEIWDTGDHSTVSLVQANAQTGTTDILGIVNGLTGMGIYSAPGFNQIDFGFETPSTGGADETFAVTGYTLAWS